MTDFGLWPLASTSPTYHDRRREGQVPGDGGEVERRYGGDEALERAVPEEVQRGARVLADGLVGVDDLLAEERVEAEEVDQLSRSVDLGLRRRYHGVSFKIRKNSKKIAKNCCSLAFAPPPKKKALKIAQN